MTDDPNETGPSAGGLSQNERDAFRRRAAALGERLDKHRADRAPKRAKSSSGGAFGQALKMAIEPLVGVLFGLGVGLALDNALGTKPLFLVIMLVIGAAAGMLNLVRSAMKTSTGSGGAKDTTRSTDRH